MTTPSGLAPSPWLPAALEPFGDPVLVRTGFPLLLLPVGAETRCAALSDWLGANARSGAMGDNRARLERHVAARLPEGGAPVEAGAILREAGAEMVASLELAEGPAKDLRAGVDALAAQVPAGAVLLPYGPDAALELVHHAARTTFLSRRAAFLDAVREAHRKLSALLETERRYDADGSATAPGGGSDLLDTGALARVIGRQRGTAAMTADRRARIETAALRLAAALADTEAPVLTVVHGRHRPRTWDPSDEVLVVDSDAPEAEAAALFDEAAEGMARTLDALRTARLELANAYEPAVHDRLRDAFDWGEFTDEELRQLAPVIAVLDDDRAVSEGMAGLSRLIASQRVVQVIVEVRPGRNPGVPDGEDPLRGVRVEPAMIALAHRQAYVQQTTPARPAHLVAGVVAALGRARAGVHVVATGYPGGPSPVGAWLRVGAAIEARALPLFQYDPAAGESWAECMDVSGNPSPEADWPAEEGGAPFTFADYAALDLDLRRHLLDGPVDGAIAVHEWLATPSDAPAAVRLAAGGARLASRRLLEACLDHRRTWRELRELGGVANEHARRAAEAARAEALHHAAEERELLDHAHAAELDAVRRSAAREVMRRLAANLLDLDEDGALAARPAPAPRPAAAPAPAPAPAPAAGAAPAPAPGPAAAPEPVAAVAEEPWVESSLCTSCNDCVQINALLFVYDDNKQIRIGDPTKGTFAELVRAAEKCPSRCIHPGAPLNPNEPGLPALIARAAAFQ